MDRFGDGRGDPTGSQGHFMNSNSLGFPILISEPNVTSCTLLSWDTRMMRNGTTPWQVVLLILLRNYVMGEVEGGPSCLCREEPLVQTLSLYLPVIHCCLWTSLFSFRTQASTLAGGGNMIGLTSVALSYDGGMREMSSLTHLLPPSLGMMAPRDPAKGAGLGGHALALVWISDPRPANPCHYLALNSLM